MAEERCKVQTYEIDFKCDICGIGHMRPTGEAIATYPVQYPHKCSYCGAEMTISGHTYPYTVTKKVKAGI